MRKYDNFASNLEVLRRASSEDLGNEFVLGGVASKFSIQLELSWKLLKELLEFEGIAPAVSGSPREILRAAFSVYDFLDEDLWLEMLRARNDLAHIYEGAAMRSVVERIIEAYVPQFEVLGRGLVESYGEEWLSDGRS